MMRKLLCVLVLALLAIGAYSCGHKPAEQIVQKKEVRTVDVAEFEKVITRPDVVLLDVRTSEEYGDAHLKGALQIDVKQGTFLAECQKQLPKGKTIAVYCRTGFRSKSAGNILAEVGYDVINLRGGITAWLEAGKPIEE